MFKPSTLSIVLLLFLTSNSYAKSCDLGKLPQKPQIPSGATASKEEMMDARRLAEEYEEKATKMLKSCKGKPEFMTLLDNSYSLSTRLDREMSIFQTRSEINVSGIANSGTKKNRGSLLQ